MTFTSTANATLITIDSINESAIPTATTWNATEVGWFYTPTFSYALSGITTKFGPVLDLRTITLEFYDAFPGSGGIILRSADFTPLSNTFSGPQFSPLNLQAHQTYFFGFRNVGGMFTNVTSDLGATSLAGGLRYSFANDGSYALGPEAGFTTQPIIQFQSLQNPIATVPDPSTFFIFSAAFALNLSRLRGKSRWRLDLAEMGSNNFTH